eukprot:TRINITY_DN3047_c0_g1_i7.p1 TRINITY_DN3047_c0_g1~~TRINITY_DN3047_c0_g1_i7.p1  ORF type:complete len:353 (+),score=129.97 TRINITY_DN3047_c0_g1_i7:80-1060(+)
MRSLSLLLAACGAASAQVLTEDYVAENAMSLWAAFRRVHRPGPYADAEEERMRFTTFAENMVKAARAQRRSPNASFGIGPLADVTDDEFKAMRGLQPPAGWRLGASLQNATLGAGVTSIDWRAKGAVTPVKNQGSCGDCWSFSATGAIEGAWKIAGHELPSLSEQELTSCDKNDNGCNGGLMDRAFQWLLDNTKGAIATEASYPFESGDGTSPQCDGHGTTGATITGYSSVLSTEAGIAAELQHGPVSIAVDASDWQHYTGGVLECSTNTQIDHGVLAVGLGKDSTGAYWIVKNSWTAAWGEDGFVRVRYGIGSCLIGEYGVRPKV